MDGLLRKVEQLASAQCGERVKDHFMRTYGGCIVFLFVGSIN